MFRVADRGNNPTPCQTGVQGIPILHRSRPARGLSGRAGRNRSAGRNLDIAGLSRWGRLRASREGVSLIRFDCSDELKFAVVNEAIDVLRARHRTVDVDGVRVLRSEEHTSELQSLRHLVCRLLLEKKTTKQ